MLTKFRYLFLVSIYTSLVLSVLSLSSCGNDDETDAPTNPDDFTYLSATIDGEQYTGLKPLSYGLNGVATIIDQSIDAKYLKLQGSDPNYSISILISENHWGALGTFPLDPQLFPTENGHYGHIVAGLSNPTIDFFNGTSGSITITKFDLDTRVFEATFELEYNRQDSNTYESTGPFYVTDGTLDFPLDHEEFE